MTSSETASVQAAKLLEQIPTILEKGLEYGTDLFERFVYYRMAMELMPLLIFIFFLIWKKASGFKFVFDEDQPFETMKSIVIGAVGITVALIAMHDIIDLIKLIFVPELYILEYFSPPPRIN